MVQKGNQGKPLRHLAISNIATHRGIWTHTSMITAVTELLIQGAEQINIYIYTHVFMTGTVFSDPANPFQFPCRWYFFEGTPFIK